MWRDQHDIWLDHIPVNPIDMLDPALALHLIGYDFALDETLGQYYNGGKQVEVAGTIDDATRRVRISRQFAPEIRNFTTAHELGHALLHDARGLHRDRPLDGSTMSRELIEIEADRFASYFLMPERLVRACFNRHFGTDRFSLDDGTQFALSRGTGFNLAKCRTLRDLSRVLAHTESYNGERFQSLAGQFKVSVEAMAIRLEELGLVVPPGA
jgi:Zn-dependent peptidase ImmA (M78 family)